MWYGLQEVPLARSIVVCNYVYLVVLTNVMSLEMPSYVFNLCKEAILSTN